ncbi:MAG TPA: 2-dehydropantoate 2-reductase N-terminal domain-containing protein [Candidatus Kryptonia bacterium]|nr:2-dehydropantoate 2-reductase N-terminal domain-containing protein [Candidatus Kryptonia bacterium]
MRFVIYGAGAVGGVIGGRLAEHGGNVVLIARGAHLQAIRRDGLRIESPESTSRIDVPAVEHPAQIDWIGDDVVLLTMKTQDTAPAVRDLAAAAPLSTPIVCVQNGVENERTALRWFARVYAVCVLCPTSYLTPGVLQAWSSPTTGVLDIGRYPSGSDDLAETIATALRTASFSSVARADIMRWKYRKLLSNLGNAIEAICGPAARGGRIGEWAQRVGNAIGVAAGGRRLRELAQREGVACLDAAGITYASEEEDAISRKAMHLHAIAGRRREGGSTWQSLQRRTRSIETDYLNGEIVLLGRRHGIPTPVNELLQRVANEMARAGTPPGTMSEEELLERLSADVVGATD